jgi:hypothetical protein
MDRVGSPQLEARFVLTGNLQTRIQHSHVLHTAGKKEVFIEHTSLHEAFPQPLLEPLLPSVRTVVESRKAGCVQVAREGSQEEDDQLLQDLEKVDTVLEVHVQPFLTGKDQVPLDVIVTLEELSYGEVPPSSDLAM